MSVVLHKVLVVASALFIAACSSIEGSVSQCKPRNISETEDMEGPLVMGPLMSPSPRRSSRMTVLHLSNPIALGTWGNGPFVMFGAVAVCRRLSCTADSGVGGLRRSTRSRVQSGLRQRQRILRNPRLPSVGHNTLCQEPPAYPTTPGSAP